MIENEFLENNGVIFEDNHLEESPDEEIIYDWDSEVVYE
jgi:hypothetical protein